MSLADTKIKDMRDVRELREAKIMFQEINLHFNLIRTICCLEQQSQLRILNLSSNKIARLGGLESLTCLEVLDLSSNKVRRRIMMRMRMTGMRSLF